MNCDKCGNNIVDEKYESFFVNYYRVDNILKIRCIECKETMKLRDFGW